MSDRGNMEILAESNWFNDEMLVESLKNSSDQYKVLGVNTCHVSATEREALDRLAADADCTMILGRDTGWFVKLYEEPELNSGYQDLGDTFNHILKSALRAGYRMVEFDCAAQTYDKFAVFDE